MLDSIINLKYIKRNNFKFVINLLHLRQIQKDYEIKNRREERINEIFYDLLVCSSINIQVFKVYSHINFFACVFNVYIFLNTSAKYSVGLFVHTEFLTYRSI